MNWCKWQQYQPMAAWMTWWRQSSGMSPGSSRRRQMGGLEPLRVILIWKTGGPEAAVAWVLLAGLLGMAIGGGRCEERVPDGPRRQSVSKPTYLTGDRSDEGGLLSSTNAPNPNFAFLVRLFAAENTSRNNQQPHLAHQLPPMRHSAPAHREVANDLRGIPHAYVFKMIPQRTRRTVLRSHAGAVPRLGAGRSARSSRDGSLFR